MQRGCSRTQLWVREPSNFLDVIPDKKTKNKSSEFLWVMHRYRQLKKKKAH